MLVEVFPAFLMVNIFEMEETLRIELEALLAKALVDPRTISVQGTPASGKHGLVEALVSSAIDGGYSTEEIFTHSPGSLDSAKQRWVLEGLQTDNAPQYNAIPYSNIGVLGALEFESWCNNYRSELVAINDSEKLLISFVLFII